MIRFRCFAIAALAVSFVLALPRTGSGAQPDSGRVGACRAVTCETSYSASGSAMVEVRGASPADAGNMLDLTVYHAATHEIAYYDTVEAPVSGDFLFWIPLGGLRPGSYAFSVTPRYSGVLLAAGTLSAAPRVLPAVPAWAPQVPEEFRRY